MSSKVDNKLDKMLKKFILFVDNWKIYIIFVETFKQLAMNKDQLLQLIKDKERELYGDYIFSREHNGVDHKSTVRCGAEWHSISSLLDNILDIEENENN